jgi:D-alanyl-D-alanine carboxypeptidase
MESIVSTVGVQEAQARIAEIRATIAALTPTRPAARQVAMGGPSFDSVLATALDEGADTPAKMRAPGDYGRLAPPRELEAYGNGRVPTSMLLPVGDGSERLHGPAAVAFRRMAEEAWRAGVDLRVNDGYRDLDHQHRLADELGLYRDGGLAAVPGTSTHGWGLSVDVETEGGALEWLRQHASQFGFVEDVPGEPWHWTYRA